ncbi:MAG: YraN family protein [Candidatus Omnitrophota bacterium]|nr:YraN family protein [Candidatus Omnitrophota bacterium]
MGREKKMTGAAGERIASAYLKKAGYRIIGSNFRSPFGEIDIVAKIGNIMVFVEVKSRITSSFGPPYLSVTKLKQRHIIKNALYYLKRHRIQNACWRIDIVSVKLDEDCGLESIELIENAIEDNYI